MEKYKQVIVVRADLKMSEGKLCVQVAHASLEAYKKANKVNKMKWGREGMKKVILKVKTLKELMDVYGKIKREKISCVLIRDAGKTQLKPGSITALGIGPDECEKIDRITKNLKLF